MSNYEKICMGIICISASLFMVTLTAILVIKTFKGC